MAQEAFECLEEMMGSFPILALPDFTQAFVLECDASGEGVGAVLTQGGHHIAFESRKLQPHEKLYLVYDRDVGRDVCTGQVQIVSGGQPFQSED